MCSRTTRTTIAFMGAFAFAASWASGADDLALRLEAVESQAALSCANERPGEARAQLAWVTFERANEVIQAITGESTALQKKLDEPEALAQEHLAGVQASERSAVRALLSDEAYELERLRMIRAPEARLEAQRDRLRAAKLRLDRYRAPASEGQKRAAAERAMSRLRELANLGGRADQAAQRSWGCWLTASERSLPKGWAEGAGAGHGPRSAELGPNQREATSALDREISGVYSGGSGGGPALRGSAD